MAINTKYGKEISQSQEEIMMGICFFLILRLEFVISNVLFKKKRRDKSRLIGGYFLYRGKPIIFYEFQS